MAEIGRLSPQVREQELAKLCADARAVSAEHRWIVLLSFLFGGSWFLEGAYPFITWHWYPYDIILRLERLRRTVVASEYDPIDNLSRWPIPKGLSHLTGKRNLDTANALGLMTTIQGSPSVIAAQNTNNATLALEIALLGAAHVVGATEPEILLGANAFPGGPSPTYFDPARLHELRLRSMVERVRSWFVEQMPQIVFPQRLEQVIQETAERSYND